MKVRLLAWESLGGERALWYLGRSETQMSGKALRWS